MKSTRSRITIAGALIVLLLSAPLGHVKTGHAQEVTGWSEPINLSNSGASSDPSMVIDNEGVIHVIWVDSVDGYKYVQSTDGVNWSAPKTIDFPFDPVEDSPPKLVADSSGSIHIFWTNLTGALIYGRAASIFLSQPQSWANIFTLADSVLDFDVVADARSSIHVTYVGNLAIDGDPAGIFYRRLDGTVWMPPVRLYTSQYFRTLDLKDSHVRLAVTGAVRTGTVYVVWDDRPANRIFLARSLDGGLNWKDAVQLRGPEDSAGLAFPYNVNVSAMGERVLLTWQVGQPGFLCSQYSQWSEDRAETIGEPVRLSNESIPCPTSGQFVGDNRSFFLMVLDLLGDLSLVAWNGTDWSFLQPQTELSTFVNSLTLDNVILDCRQITHYANTIYVVGCDRAGDGDIWLRYRHLGSLEDWFPPPSAWAGPISVSSVDQMISSGVAVADNRDGFHMMWIQHLPEVANVNKATIQYVRWNSENWSKPTNIITSDITGYPQHLTAAPDEQGGVILAWVQGVNGDIYFSRANGDRAYLASEWSPALRIPSLSDLNTTPDIITDSSNRIILVYSVPFNENRGIYLVQSVDLGRNWSQPVRVFDAVAVNWDSVDQPKIVLSNGGRLHLLMTRKSLREGEEQASLYYLQSLDGGTTWKSPEVVSERSVQWSEIVHVGNDVLYRLWQERNGEEFETFSEISNDGGLTWSGPLKATSVSGNPATLTLTTDAAGQLYLVQTYVSRESLIMEQLNWDGSRWTAEDSKRIPLSRSLDRYFITSGIAPDRTLHFLVSIDYVGSTESGQNEVLGYRRYLDPLNDLQTPTTILIPTPAESMVTEFPQLDPTPTQPSPLAVIEESFNTRLRNRVGLALVAGVLILTLIFLIPAFRRKQK